MNRSFRSQVATLLLPILLVGGAATGQPSEMPKLTLEDLFLEPKFEEEVFTSSRWAAEGPVVTFIRSRDDGVTDIVSYDLAQGEERLFVDGSKLVLPDTRKRITVQGYEVSPDGKSILLYTDSEKVWRHNTMGYYYLLDLASGRLVALSDRELGHQMFAKFDPTGRRIGFVRNRNLFVTDLASDRETQLTRDGGPGAIINGTSDWVYEEEFGVRDAWRWSPDGRYIAFLQFDETRTRDYWLPDNRGLYPEFKRFRYPKAGERNSEIRAGVIDVDSMRTTFFNTDTWYSGGEEHEYLNAIGWTPPIDSLSRAWVFRMNRDQNRLQLVYLNPTTGKADVVLREEEPAYINAETGFGDLDISKLTFLRDDSHFVWISEEDGFRHLYLHAVTGERLGRLTRGNWDVTTFHGVDEDSGTVYFSATIDGSTERHLYRLPFSVDSLTFGAPPERITSGEGWHDVSLSSDRRYFIDRWTTSEMPQTVSLRTASGQELRILEDNAELKERLAKYAIRPIEFGSIPGAAGDELNAYFVKPTSFNPERAYPLLMYVYGGPGSQHARKEWIGARRLWFQMLADEHDLIIVCVDNRGTGGRGKTFETGPYKKLGILEAEDQIAAAKWLTGQRYIDAERVGIWGWSYGGFMTLMSMFTGDGPDTFDFGISVAPVTTWRQYDTIYTERYMSTPEKNPEGYSLASPISHVERMSDQQRLLIAHGDMDDNVHFQNSVQLVDALQKAGKQFQFMVYPGKDHAILGNAAQYHLHKMMTDFIVSNIQTRQQ
ncbi:MAG TPA: S9 family peptidase [Rhodothermales bacterium]|nr:S9 family peptidase [Rhodothermales bacterium]